MIKLDVLDGEHTKYLDKVIDNKNNPRKTLLKYVQDYVKSRYLIYDLKQTNLENIGESTISLNVPSTKINAKYSLLHMYNSPEQYAKEYLKDIKKILKDGTLCPYCALTEAKQIDHFLPKSIFPEFSLYLPNMIVICTDCNTSKDNIAINTTTNTRFALNPYHDINIYSHDFIVCEILPPFEAAKFNIKITDALSSAEQELCLEHIKTVAIERKIVTLWRNYFDELAKRLEKTYIKKHTKYNDEEMIEKFKEIILDEIDTKSIDENIIQKALFIECESNQVLLEYWLNIFKEQHKI